MPEIFKVVILGIVEGVTEFLPISSTGHLIVFSVFLDLSVVPHETFDIFIQFGAVIAVIAFYRADLFRQVRSFHKDSSVQRLWIAILVAAVPAGFFGFLLKDKIQSMLFNPTVVALSLIVGGIVFLVLEHHPKLHTESNKQLSDITFRQALIVGIVQTIALIPGVSRSGASIIGGIWGGMSREAATQFSFYLAIPVLGGATLFELVTSLDALDSGALLYLLIGALISGIVAWFMIGWLLRYVTNNNFVMFGWYRIIAGILILIMIAARLFG